MTAIQAARIMPERKEGTQMALNDEIKKNAYTEKAAADAERQLEDDKLEQVSGGAGQRIIQSGFCFYCRKNHELVENPNPIRILIREENKTYSAIRFRCTVHGRYFYRAITSGGNVLYYDNNYKRLQ